MLRFIRRLSPLAEIVNAVAAIIGWIGWAAGIIAAGLALATSAFAWFERLPYVVIWTCGFTMLVMSIYLLKAPAFYRLLKQAAPNAKPSEVWRQVQTFFLSQAACLFAGMEPLEGPHVPQGPAVPWLTMLMDAVASNEVERISDPQQDQFNMMNGVYRPSVSTRISRDELRKFAAKRNQHPKFLETA